jgi:ferric-dicitrate binding protein FerR (iron transport regulator)
MARSLSGEATPEEQNELKHLLQNDEALQQHYDVIQRLWQNNKQPYNADGGEEQKLQQIFKLANSEEKSPDAELLKKSFHKKRKRGIKKFAIPFLVAIILVFSFVLWLNSNVITTPQTKSASQIVEAKNGSRTRTILPDGSTVWLNAGSTIAYEGDMDGELREVHLTGEAFFDVVKVPSKPFIVHASGVDIKVLGTSFNVKSYPADKTIETTLIKGLVQVIVKGTAQQKPIVLHPNEKLTLQKNAADNSATLSHKNTSNPSTSLINFQVTPIDTTASEAAHIETAWVYNKLAFHGDSFEELGKKLERWYNVEVVFEDDKVKLLNFNGSFEDESLEQAFKALKTAVPFNYKIIGHKIYIKSIK